MKRMLAGLALVLGTAALSGCYYDPGYSYVRSNGYQGDAYYGRGETVIYDDDYYAPGYYGYAPGYYGYAPGVSVGIGGVWYGESHYRGRDRDWDHDRRWQRENYGRRGRDFDDRGHGERGARGRGDWHSGRDHDHDRR